MIIWINGTFGSGKTTAAYELHKRIPNSFVYDPERFGYVLMANVPKDMAKADFQDYPLWREANYQLLKEIASQYEGILIIPMTLTNEEYFEEIIGRLKKDRIEIMHFTLVASKETIAKRLRKRFEGKDSWAYKQLENRLSLLAKAAFQFHIQTDDLSIDEVVEVIANEAGIHLLPDTRSPFKKGLDRLKVQLKELAIFK